MRHTLLVAIVALAPALSAQATGQRTREQIRASYLGPLAPAKK